MKVLLIWPYYPPEQGAASNRGVALQHALERSGAEVIVAAPHPSYLTSDRNANARKPEIRIPARLRSHNRSRLIRIAREILGAAILPFSIARFVRKVDISVVSSPPLAFGLAGVIAARLARVPVVLDIRDPWPEVIVESGEVSPGVLSRCARLAAMLAYKSATRVSVVTRGTLANLENAGIPRDKLFLAPNGIDNSLLEKRADKVDRSRRRQFRIVYSGLLGPAQGIGILFRALGKVSYPIRVDIYGEGVSEPELRRAAAETNVEIRFHGLVSREDALDAMLLADLAFVPLASREMRGTVPSKLYEALGLGIPVLVVAEGNAAEIAKESGAGFVSTPGDAEALRANIEEAIARRDELSELGESGKTYVALNYLRSEIFSHFVAMLTELIPPASTLVAPSGQLSRNFP